MNKFSFSYLVTCYALASVFTFNNHLSLEYQIIGSLFLIVLFGIPHGAIDNIILQSQTKISSTKFYTLYLSIIIFYTAIWFLSPLYSFYFFLLMSAYHFGESQFANYKIITKTKKIIYLLWGISLMSSLFFYNKIELSNLFLLYEDTSNLNNIFGGNNLQIIFFTSNFLTLFYLFYLRFNKKLKSSVFNSELFQMLLIHITFYLFPVIISFTLYFVFLHSLKVLSQEFKYLNRHMGITSILKFIKLLAPHTILSLIFVSIFIFLSSKNIIDISILLFSIISISVITLPHSIVMTKFYEKFKI